MKLSIFDGLITDKSAYDTLVKQYGCCNDKISNYNILKMKMHDFERIFVFYRDDAGKTKKDNIIEGEKKLEKLMKALALMCKILSQYDESLYGQMAEVAEVKKPEASKIDFKEMAKLQQPIAFKDKNI